MLNSWVPRNATGLGYSFRVIRPPVDQLTLGKSRRSLGGRLDRFWLAMLIMLAMFLNACGSTGSPQEQNLIGGAQIDTVTPELTAEPTTTSTPEPTLEPTVAVVEIELKEEQDWINLAFADADYHQVRVADTNVANALPWTVDENGNIVQGVVDLEFDGTGAFLMISERESYSKDWIQFFQDSSLHPEITIGPSFILEGLRGQIPEKFIGDLTQEELTEMQEFFSCLNSPTVSTRQPMRIEHFLDSDAEFFEIVGGIWDISSVSNLEFCLGQVK